MLKAIRIVAWLLALAIVVLSLVPPNLRPVTDAPHDLEHLGIFAATGFAWGLGYGQRYFPVAIGLVIFAGAIEIAQLFVPGRHARLSDFIVDALATCIGLLASSFVSMRKFNATSDS
jgi:VanZ family protein